MTDGPNEQMTARPTLDATLGIVLVHRSFNPLEPGPTVSSLSPRASVVRPYFIPNFGRKLAAGECHAAQGLENRLRLRNIFPMLPLHLTFQAVEGSIGTHLQPSQLRTLPLHFSRPSVTFPVTFGRTPKGGDVQSHDVSEDKQVGRMSPAPENCGIFCSEWGRKTGKNWNLKCCKPPSDYRRITFRTPRIYFRLVPNVLGEVAHLARNVHEKAEMESYGRG